MTEWRPRGKSRWAIMAAVAAVAASVALPASARAAAPASAAGPTEFSSSFESTDQQPTWMNTVETDASGRRKADGVDGSLTTGIPGSIMDNVVGITASAENTGGGEVKENLIDGDPMTKWLAFAPTGWVQLALNKPIAAVDYVLTSANDHPQRDPRDWTLQGSTDGQNWTVLDTRTGETFANRFQSKEYRFANTTPYLYYKLDITANGGEQIVQLADLALSNGDTTTPPPSDMKSQVGSGPASSPTAKAKAGFTGVKALEYQGRHLNAGRAYSYNKIYQTSIRVTRDTELSYKIFPELLNNDLTYPSTYAAVDLAFTDGTYLSDLGAVDQQNVRLDPRSQGSSKTLYTQQWNHKWSRIGDVAAGRTIARILVAYDNPTGNTASPPAFRGWIDDLRVSGHAVAEAPAPKHLSDNVLTTRGTNASGSFSRGNNFPATAVPHGFNFWTPETNAGSQSWLYEYAHANNADNLPVLQAFAASHEPSPWMGDRQTFQVMPSTATGVPDADRTARGLPFSHSDEIARPYYYSVTAQNKLRTEIAPTDHAAVFRFTFPTADANLIFDNVNNNGGLVLNPLAGSLSGYSDVKSGLSTGAGRLFVYAQFDRPVAASGMLPGGGGANVTGYYRFRLGADRQVTMRIATSLISVEQARHNLELEIAPRDSFDTVKDRARKLWDGKLGIVTVQGASADQRATLYSNLYRLFLYPNSGFENTGSASRPAYEYASAFSPPVGPDTPDHTGAKIAAGKDYVNNGFWDTYRTTWPAYSLLTPTEAGEMIDGFVQQYKDGGWIARWSSPGYANLMTGTSSDVAFADAYLKGVKFDVKAAYQAALKNATVAPPNDNVGRKGLASSIFLGYTPTTTGEGMSWAMEG
ncbi:MAG: glycoside hydrolase domain-containing protein, partial [Mycobacteriales bacterium]